MGKLHSSRSHFEDVQDVASGAKPVALVDLEAGNYAEELGLQVISIPKGSYSMLSKRLAKVVYRPETKSKALEVLRILKDYPLDSGPRSKDFHVRMGKALGYSDEDIDTFLSKFFR